MAWDFETDPDYQKELDWVDEFVREEIEPLTSPSLICSSPRLMTTAARSSTRSRKRSAVAGCGRPIWDLNWAGKATDS